MAKFRKRGVLIEAITFDELVAIGVKQGVPLTNGMPWSFNYQSQLITHENDNCYLVPTLEGTMKFNRGDMLIAGVRGEIYSCKADIFAATYTPEQDDASLRDMIRPLLIHHKDHLGREMHLNIEATTAAIIKFYRGE